MAEHASSILLVISLFLLGVLSPGPNFLVVVEQSLSSGRKAGLVTGLGIATGDALYAAAGLLGFSSLMMQARWLLGGVKLLGGLYISFLGLRLLKGSTEPYPHGSEQAEKSYDPRRCFRRGLLTDLSNPKTILFFASIFAVAYEPGQPGWTLAAMWLGIVLSSVGWRVGLATVFSRHTIRRLYLRFRRHLERVFGAALALFGLHLILNRKQT